MPTPEEVELAELITGRVSYVEQIRFCNSGTEAVMLAIKAARAFTGRPKIAKFEGAYHGLYDYAEVSEGPTPDDWGDANAPASITEPGTPHSVASDVVVLPWNRPEACRKLIEQNRNDLAALLVDPMPLGIGMIAPRPGFLQWLRESRPLWNRVDRRRSPELSSRISRRLPRPSHRSGFRPRSERSSAADFRLARWRGRGLSCLFSIIGARSKSITVEPLMQIQ